MSSRKLLFALGALGLIILGLWLLRPQPEPVTVKPSPASPTPLPPVAPASSKPNPEKPQPAEETGYVDPPVSAAINLNLPAGTIAYDLQILGDIFNGWRIDFPRLGNPVGDNAEITAALTGNNPLRLPLIPRHHPAINSDGELCDRWGTPFRFHALSGTRMEIRSAGPDKKFGTTDDSVMTPP